MPPSITIDPQTGDAAVAGTVVGKHTHPYDLPALFTIGAESDVMVLGVKVPCLFARATVRDSNRDVDVELRFERGTLVSVFVHLRDSASDPATAATHLEWLRDKLGPQQGMHTRYGWGVAGVATDKSGDSHAFLHNANNTWGR